MDLVACAFNFSIQENLEHENHHSLEPSLDYPLSLRPIGVTM